jgi:THO complex subunit 2
LFLPKADGVNAAQWLSSLETFTGAFYKRFPDVELRGLLAYLTRRLHEGYTLELGILQSLVKMAGGYGFMDSESTASLSDVQLEGRCGSLALRRETSDFGIVEKINIHSSRRLRKSLQDGGRGVIFLILLSQLRAKVLFDESRGSPKQIKLIGNLYDKCHRTMNVLLAFLTDGSQDVIIDAPQKNTGAIAQYGTVVPSLDELLNIYALANHDAWTLCRPLIRASLFLEEDNISKGSDERLKSFNPNTWNFDSILHLAFPKETWDHMSQLLFIRFFSHSIYDLTCPTDTYENELARLKREIDRLEMLQKGGRDAIGIQASMASAVAAAGGTQRDIREATAFTKEHAIELERLKTTTQMLSMDMERQKRHSEYVINSLKSERNELFSNIKSTSIETSSIFFATCIFPRCLSSPEDAIYCARFIKLLHDINTPGFPVIPLFDVIVNSVVGALYSITEDEAGCFGVFMHEIWKTISLWRYDEEAYKSHISFKVCLL